MTGLKEAVAEMKRLMPEARGYAILGPGTDIVEIARIEAVIPVPANVWQGACAQ